MTTNSIIGLAGIGILALALAERQDPAAWAIGKLQVIRAIGMCLTSSLKAAYYHWLIHWPICKSNARQQGN